MSADDPDKKPLNQTRFGTPTGHANERQMLDSRADTFGIRTIIKQNADGTETMCRTHAGMPRFFTDEAPTSTEPEDTCPLTDVGFVNSNYVASGIYTSTEHLDWKLYNLFGRNGAVKTAKYARNTISKKEQLMHYGSTLFSGLMRRVVQLHNGKAAEDIWFNPGWSVTDGLYIGVGNYGKITRYVIRIDSTGIWRIPITFCKDLTATWQADETTWLTTLTEQQAHDKIAPYWTPTKLDTANKVKIADAPPCFADGFAPFYDWCGWAFNYTGNKATVVCTAVKPGETWLTNRLYDITISDAAGVPTSATCAVTLEDKFINPYNDASVGASTAGLQAATIMPGLLETYQFHDSISYPASAPNQDSPVFSYYEKSGAKIVVKLFYKNGSYGVTTTNHQTLRARFYTATGTYKGSSYDSGLGYAVTYDISPYPESIYSNTEYLASTGPFRTTTTGTTGKNDVSFYSPHVAQAQETYSVSIAKIDLEDAGFGYTQGISDAGRFVDESRVCCIMNGNMYVTIGGYVYPGAVSTAFDATVRYIDQSRTVNFAWQVSTTYSESQSEKTVLLLHGADRESYAVAKQYQRNTGVKNSSLNTNGAIGPCSVIPTGPMIIDLGTESHAWVNGGLGISFYGGAYPPTIVGSLVGDEVIGSVVFKTNGELSVDGGTRSIPASSASAYSITTRVGETNYTSTITDTDVFTVYGGGFYFRFRACAAAWDKGRQVRQVEINQASLQTENLGGCRPSANITTFIGVI